MKMVKKHTGKGFGLLVSATTTTCFYIFTNVNGHGMQVYISKDPKGPWVHKPMNTKIYDLSVLFDDDGKIYAVYNYDEVRMVELKPDMSGIVEGTEKSHYPCGKQHGRRASYIQNQRKILYHQRQLCSCRPYAMCTCRQTLMGLMKQQSLVLKRLWALKEDG